MKKSKLFIDAFLFLGWLVLALIAQSPRSLAWNPEPSTWSSEMPAALNRAKAEGKMIFVEIAPDWYIDSEQTEDKILANPKIEKLLAPYIRIKVIPTRVLEALNIPDQLDEEPHFPLFCIVDAQGVVAATIGGRDVDQFQKSLEDFQTKLDVSEAPFEVNWSISTSKNQTYRFDLPNTAIAQSPTWSKADNSPPLAPRNAMRCAQSRLDEITKSAWKFEFIRLSPIDAQGHWAYRVVYRPNPPPDLFGLFVSRLDSVPVLMDGYVPKPQLDKVWAINQDPRNQKNERTHQLEMLHGPPLTQFHVQLTLGRFRYKYYQFDLTPGEIASSPAWNEAETAPALSPREAIEIAEARLNEIVQPPAWKFDFLDLAPLDQKKHWAYLVTFRRIDPPDARFWDRDSLDVVPVLMNAFAPVGKLIDNSPRQPAPSPSMPFVVDPPRSSPPSLEFHAPPPPDK